MNPPFPLSDQASFTFIPQEPTPNHNPSPSFLYSDLGNPLRDLSSTLSSLKNLINLADQTLQSLSNRKLDLIPNDGEPLSLVPCPFNRHHRIPPSSLFRHSLLCRSSRHPPLDPDQLLQPLRYPKTLKSSEQLLSETRLFQNLPDSQVDFCFSVNEYSNSDSNFFYLDCPGVVSSFERDDMDKMFTMPRFLAVECSNVSCFECGEKESIPRESFRILPSELWGLRREIGAWNDYPSEYSYSVLCSILGLQMVNGHDLKTWIIANSPYYGVIIDVAMRDHIYVLLRLCLKAILREAVSLVDRVQNECGSAINTDGMSLKCPIAVQALSWLAFRLSILYGEINGKFFVLNMVRECILVSAGGLLFFQEKQGVTVTVNTSEEGSWDSVAESESEKVSKPEESVERRGTPDFSSLEEATVTSGSIFMSQVAAAIAAINERSLLEGRIKELRVSQQLPKEKVVAEYENITLRADEERRKRPNYRPIIDHDGLPRQQSDNQETKMTKTKEEVLAEERDYKRRRMSYRGKKVKRTTLQVMRDIIEDYMEEIKKAGGIGCFAKETEREGNFPLTPPNHGIKMAADNSGIEASDRSAAARHGRNQARDEFNNSARTSHSRDTYARMYEPRQRNHVHEYWEDERRSISKGKHSRAYYSRSPDRFNRDESWNHSSHQRERTKTRNDESRGPLSHGKRSSYFVSKSADGRRDSSRSRGKDRWQSQPNESRGSDTWLHDRYEPSESHDVFEDNLSDSKYARPDDPYFSEETQRSTPEKMQRSVYGDK